MLEAHRRRSGALPKAVFGKEAWASCKPTWQGRVTGKQSPSEGVSWESFTHHLSHIALITSVLPETVSAQSSDPPTAGAAVAPEPGKLGRGAPGGRNS